MKITQIDVYGIKYTLKGGAYALSRGRSISSLPSTITKVSTDEGLSGFGEICPIGSAYMEAYARGIPSGIKELGPLLIGQDPMQTKHLNNIMDSAMQGHKYIKAPLDVACWDLLGKAVGVPLCALLGGRYVDSYPLYRVIPQDSGEKMADETSRFRMDGYRHFQLKVGGNPRDDVGRIKSVLNVLQPGDILLADANTGWLTHEAIRVSNAVSGEDLYIEQPCLTLDECAVVRKHTQLPMILDESITDIRALLKAYQRGILDVANLKITRVGGLTKAKQIRDFCEALGIAMTIEDSWGGDITTATIAHLVASTRPQFYLTSTDFNSYVDLKVAMDGPKRIGGQLPVPVGAGLGIQVDEKALGEPVLTIK
jgi:L-alanine-DL-glutamate epimerase-like enolase superfamily enzyme